MANQQKSAEEIFGIALDLPLEQRTAYLDAACQGSVDLRQVVDRLLLDHARLGNFLTDSPLKAVSGPSSSATGPIMPFLPAGRTLGRYTILGPLGSGGMGTVYRARDERLERVIALKVMSPDLFHGDGSRERFRKEALALARLSHANIAAIYDVGEENGVDYIVMECIAGQTLAARLKLGPLPAAEALTVAQQVAAALEEAHELGVIHRDLKPANIMITARGNIKVLDFGIAKLAALETTGSAAGEAGTFIGTPLYMSPEQVQGKNVDTRTDLWSLGVVLYESLTGHTPFAAGSAFAILQAIVQQPPAPLTGLHPEVPSAVEHVIIRLLQKDPGQRFQSAKDLLRETSAALVHTGAHAAPLTLPSPVTPARTPRKGLKLGLAMAFAALLVVAAVLAIRSLRPKPSPPATVTPVPLTTYQGSETSPSFSPDGGQVAFQWNGEAQDNEDIYVKGMAPDATPLRLTTSPMPDRWPAWSPDGRTIAFERVAAPGRLYLMLIPAVGGPERKLAELRAGEDPAATFVPAWSPDSKWLFVSSRVQEHLALFRISVETGELTRVTNSDGGLDDTFPTISPDGRTLLFKRRPTFYLYGRAMVERLDENASPLEAAHAISIGGHQVSEAVWMPDGREILARTADGYVRVPAAGSGDAQPVPGLRADARQVAVSLRGNRLAYAQAFGDANIWRIDLTARTLQPQRLIASTFRDVYPQYSPDGTRLAFESTRTGGPTQVWISDAGGKNSRQMTSARQGLAASPHWSPDGRTLEFDSNSNGRYQIYIMSPDGGQARQLTQGPSVNYLGAWSRDGRWIYFASDRSGQVEVWKMPDGGGLAVQVTHNGGTQAMESLDGRTLYFNKPGAEGSVWSMPLPEGAEKQLIDSLYRTNFAVSARGIYFMAAPGEDGTASLKLYNFATGAITTVLPVGLPEYGLGLSPDGRYLAYAQLDDPASDLMLVENFH